MSQKAHQLEFSSILFDTLFGLIIFFNLENFLQIKEPLHFFFYLLSVFIVVHWWLMFKSTDDNYGIEASFSVVDLLMGIGYIVSLAYFVNFASEFLLVKAVFALVVLFVLELTWSLAWQYIGKWHTKNKNAIKKMEWELNVTIITDVVVLVLLAILWLVGSLISAPVFVGIFLAIYALYVYLTFHYKMISFQIF